MNDNLKFWNEVEKTNPEFTSEATISGRKITSIDAYVQIKEATEKFGKYGETWGLKDTSMDFKEIGETLLCIYKATFYAPNVEFPIYNSIKVSYRTSGQSGYIKVDDEFTKKVETNTITKSLTRLGFNTDIFMGKFEDSRYVEEISQEFEEVKLNEYADKLRKTKSIEQLSKVYLSLPAQAKIALMPLKDELKAQYENIDISK